MCGLAGLLDPRHALGADALAATAAAMAGALRHRGPDDDGTWAEAGIALGHRRLSIVDLSAAGHQPMTSASGRWVLAYNGELYNARELRAALDGVAWRGHSDTEVLLEGIARWGVADTLARVNGMFAFAAWDRAAGTLALGRDRVGEKPLYYGWHADRFLFASELKAFAHAPGWTPVPDRAALALFMRLGYIPAPHAAWTGVHKLPAGCLIVLDREAADRGVTPEPVPYWDVARAVADAHARPFGGTLDDAADALDALLRDAVARRMVADVPLGAFLSGGIDSSTVVAMMQRAGHAPSRTFSIGFDEPGYDESAHARAVAGHLGTVHEELRVSADDARAVIPRLGTMYDEPFADASQVPTFLVSALARRHVTVALSGDGGDELFAGYPRYRNAETLWPRLARWPAGARAAVAGAMHGVSVTHWDALLGALRPILPAPLQRADAGRVVHRVADVLASESPEAFYVGLVSQDDDPGSLVGGTEPPTWLTTPDRWPALPSAAERMMFLDLVTYLTDDILAKVDRASMAVGLEVRVPLLDHRVVEFAWSLPLALKLGDGTGKAVLRRVLDRYVPRTLVERPKMGFSIPLDAWLRGPLREWAESLLDAPALARGGVLDVTRTRAAWEAHLAGRENRQYWIWHALMLQSWLLASRAP
ncbi:MAG: asparagine synthase (glutamine-hydrolyzing) [Gemmatimonadetes bacterium]|nr:asparagine synthase (glutamine-hydrolyzing) [Gemmatimonadota bacterium]